MTALRSRVPDALLIAACAAGFLIVHTIAYIGAYPTSFGHALADTGHGYLVPLLVLVAAGGTGAIVSARQRAAFASRRPRTLTSRRRIFVDVWSAVLGASLAGYLVAENLDALIANAELPLMGALAYLGIPAVAVALLVATAVIAAAVMAITTTRERSYEGVITGSYRDLVASGTYSAGWSQPPWAVAFVSDVISRALDRGTTAAPSVLECGCGTGVWLTTVAPLVRTRHGSLHGFDLSPEMADAARDRLGQMSVEATVWVGDILDDDAFQPGGGTFDLIFAYDVVQQLPANVQADSIDSMLAHVRRGGSLVIFDNDRKSRFGRVMGAKKWLRRYFNVPLVPRFYIHARYPDLEAMRRRAERAGHDTEIRLESELRKRALVIHRS